MGRVKQIVQSKYFELVLLLAILIFGFGVRLWKITNPIADWHSWRQADTAAVTRIYVEQGINLLTPRYYDISRSQTGFFNPQGLRYVELPLYNALHALLTKNFPLLPLEVWGRLVSIFCALVSGIFMYLLGKKFIDGRWGGILAAFFFLFLPYNIYFTRVILPEPMAITFALASIWFFIKHLEKDDKLLLVVSGILFAASTLIKPFTLFYGLPLIYLALAKHGKRAVTQVLHFYWFAALAIIPFFLWRIYINQFPQGIPHFDWAFNSDHIRFRPAFWRWLFGERLGRMILGIWGLIPFAFGLIKVEGKKLFAHLFFLGVILYMTLLATANVRHDYYQIFLIPPVALFLAQGVREMFRQGWLARFLAIFSVVMMFGMSAYQIKENYKINHPEIIAAGKAVERLTPKDAWVIAPYNADTAFLYQTHRFGWPIVNNSFDYLIGKGADYYVSVNLTDTDTRYIEKRFKVIEKTDQYLVADLHAQLPGYIKEVKK